jgi:hypothetical protein
MPYIKNDGRREELEDGDVAETCGELNFQITKMCLNYLDFKGLSYQTLNDIIGAMAASRAEFYRRVVEPYEKKKEKENGDVY